MNIELLKGQQLGLHGEHQNINAGLAVALSSTWLKKTGHAEGMNLDETVSLSFRCFNFFIFFCDQMCNLSS